MPRARKLTPRYLPHKQSGRGRAVWTDANGKRQEQLLPGAYESAVSRKAFGKLLLEHEVAPKPAAGKGGSELSLMELLDAYRQHAERHYRDSEGKHTSELREVKLVVKAVREVYGELPAADFSPLKLKAVRQGWIVAGLSRAECNRRVNIVRRIFKWAAGEELIPPSVYHGLIVVTGLQRGRTTARETTPVGPVDDATVDATIPHLNRFLVGLVEVQRLTGMRPGEACIIRRADLELGSSVWLYRPTRHKTAHKGKARVVAIGPKGQEILREFFTTSIDDYLFSPRRAVAEFHESRTQERTTPRYKSHMDRNRRKRVKLPKRPPAEHYTAESYGHAIACACDRAFPPPEPLAQRQGETAAEWKARLTKGQREQLNAWRKAHRWHPNQLRHTFATKVRKAEGLEAAQVMLGHARADVTQVYAERNESLAVAVASRIG